MSKIGATIRKVRLHMGITQRELGEKVGFDRPNMVNMIENDKAKLPIERITPMAKALGLNGDQTDRFLLTWYREVRPTEYEAIKRIINRKR